MNATFESGGVVEALENMSSDSADVERNSEVKVSGNTGNVHADILDNPAPDRKVHLCDPCVIDESENRACAFCVVCVEYLCERCCREHKKYKATRNHKVLKDNIPEEPTTFKYIRKMMTCTVHDETEVTHKCEDHNTYVCVLCTAGVHRKCETVTELSESFTMSENKASELRLKIEELKEKNHRVSITQNANIHDLTIEKKGIIETVNKFTSDLLEMKSKIVHDTDRLTEEHLKALKQAAAKCTTFEDEYKLFREVLETVEVYGTKIEVNMMLAIIQEKLDLAEQELEKQQNREEMHLLYTRNKHMPLFQTLGTLEVKGMKSKTDGENKCEEVTQSIISKENTFKDTPKLEGKHLEETNGESKTNETFCIQLLDDFFECSVSGCVVLDDGTIVIIDEENRKIKVYDTSYKFIDAVEFIAPPSDICVTDNYKFAVVYKVVKKIKIFELKNKQLWTVRKIPTKYENSRISAHRTSKQIALVYHIEYRLRGCIQIREFSGKVLQDISLNSILSVSDQAEFGICYLEDDLVVVSKSSGVKCLIPSKSGGCITAWQFNLDDNIEVTRYISADKDGNIYICSPANDSIYRISRKCPKSLVSRIQNPLSVTIDNERKRMIVGCFMTNCAHVVYSPFIS